MQTTQAGCTATETLRSSTIRRSGRIIVEFGADLSCWHSPAAAENSMKNANPDLRPPAANVSAFYIDACKNDLRQVEMYITQHLKQCLLQQ